MKIKVEGDQSIVRLVYVVKLTIGLEIAVVFWGKGYELYSRGDNNGPAITDRSAFFTFKVRDRECVLKIIPDSEKELELLQGTNYDLLEVDLASFLVLPFRIFKKHQELASYKGGKRQ